MIGIEHCNHEQHRRHLAGDQSPWLTRKFLCETHRNKSAWINSLEQAEVAANKQRRIAIFVYRKDIYSRSAQNGVKVFLKCFHNCNLCRLMRLPPIQPPKF